MTETAEKSTVERKWWIFSSFLLALMVLAVSARLFSPFKIRLWTLAAFAGFALAGAIVNWAMCRKPGFGPVTLWVVRIFFFIGIAWYMNRIPFLGSYIPFIDLYVGAIIFIAFVFLLHHGKKRRIAARIIMVFASILIPLVLCDLVLYVADRYGNVRTEPPKILEGSREENRFPVVEEWIMTAGDTVIFHCVSTTDEFGRRTSPYDREENAGKHAMFFGCSFTWGTGLNDSQTLPAQFGNMTDGYNIYNYSRFGYGLQHPYHKISSGTLKNEVAEKDGVCIYVYRPGAHIERATGKFISLANWAKNFPCYRLDDNGRPVYHGTLREVMPVREKLYSHMYGSPLARKIGLKLLNRASDEDEKLGIQLIRFAAEEYRQQFNGRFYVLFEMAYPGRLEERIVKELAGTGIEFIYVNDELTQAEKKEGKDSLHIKGDGHPTPRYNYIVAKKCVRTIESNRGKQTETHDEN